MDQAHQAQQDKLARERMAANEFAPMQPGSTGADTHALNYIAFYLGEIERHLANLVEQSQALTELVGNVLKR
jgi:hypothetical protein